MNIALELLSSGSAINACPKRGLPLALVHNPHAELLMGRLWSHIYRGELSAVEGLVGKGEPFHPESLGGRHRRSQPALDFLWRCSSTTLCRLAPAVAALAPLRDRACLLSPSLVDSAPLSYERFTFCRFAVHFANRELDGDLGITLKPVETPQGFTRLLKDLKEWRTDIDVLSKTPLSQLQRHMRVSEVEILDKLKQTRAYRVVEHDVDADFRITRTVRFSEDPLFGELHRLFQDEVCWDDPLAKVSYRIETSASVIKLIIDAITPYTDKIPQFATHFIEARSKQTDALLGVAETTKWSHDTDTAPFLHSLLSGWWNADPHLIHHLPYQSGIGSALLEKVIDNSFCVGAKGRIQPFTVFSTATDFYVKAGCVIDGSKALFFPKTAIPILLNMGGGRLHPGATKEKTDGKANA